MTKTLSDLTPEQAKELITRVSQVMYKDYNISETGIKAFWDTLRAGVNTLSNNTKETSHEYIAYT